MALIRPATRFDGTRRTYDGSQLRSHWIFEEIGLQGDAIVAFRGPAEVRGEHLVDLVDRRDGLFIAADDMLHLVLEAFDPRLDRAVFLQRLLDGVFYDFLDNFLDTFLDTVFDIIGNTVRNTVFNFLFNAVSNFFLYSLFQALFHLRFYRTAGNEQLLIH